MTYPICERLVRFDRKVCVSSDLEVEAAAIIEELAAVVEPFAAVEIWEGYKDEEKVLGGMTIGDLRRAHEALRKLKGEVARVGTDGA